MNVLKLTASQLAALKLAGRHGVVYSGWNPGTNNVKVNGNTLASLERMGLLTLHYYKNETSGRLTKAGVAALEAK